MSALVFAGSLQLVAVDIRRHPAPWLLLGVTALTINLRHAQFIAATRLPLLPVVVIGATGAVLFRGIIV